MRSKKTTVTLALVLATIGVVWAIPASASAAPAPGWEITSHSAPANLPPGGHGLIYLDIFNIGAANSEEGKTITVTDQLPPGVTATHAGGLTGHPTWDCTGTSLVRCTNDPIDLSSFPGGGGAPGGRPRHPDLEVGIQVSIAPGAASTLVNRAAIAGGGAPSGASTTSPLHINSEPAPFGVANWDAWFSNEDGTIDTQAGSHPYEASFDLEINSVLNPLHASEPELRVGSFLPAGGELRDVAVDLPPGFVGDPTAVPQCPRASFDSGGALEAHCPADTVIGAATSLSGALGLIEEPVYNIVPPPGVAAQFGFLFDTIPTFLDSSVRTGGDSGITTRSDNTPTDRGVVGAMVTLWGVPGDPSHNSLRCLLESCPAGAGAAPLLTLPTACGAPQPFTVHVSQWEDPGVTAEKTSLSHDSNDVPTGFTGCESLGFGPTITTAPDTSDADTPAGLTVEVKPQLGGLQDVTGLSTSDIQNTTVTLPQGFVINPGQAAGLQACGPTQDGLTTEAEKAEGKENDGPAECPNASKVGTDEIETPLLPHSLKGDVYVLQSNPPELKLLVTASGEGVNLKLVGVVHLDEQTGQLTTTFQGTPELPFSDFKLSFSGGAQAALDTPTECGLYTTNADFNPWSSPLIADALTDAQFGISAGPGGGACPSVPLPFTPTLTAGSTTDQAGGLTDFSMLLQRGDGQQRIEKLQFKEPAGLAGLIANVAPCQEPQAAQGTCSAASHIGHAVVASGPGPYPLVIPQPGEPEAGIFLTGPYKGAPFGLSIVTPVIAGPFNLGTIVTRAAIEVDPRTAQITITTDPLPQVVAGVPTDLRSINAIIDRPNFLFNPTSCEPSAFSGTAWGTPPPGAGGPGATAQISSHFGVGSCQSLKFKPSLSVATAAHGSRATGASLTFKIAYPKGSLGSQAWFNEAQFDIPKQLPARLSTIQQACLAATFERDRAACPKHSIIGHAVVHTEVLPVPLEGPVYFVSYGGAKFPDAVIVLDGDNVHIELHGETFIKGKTGVTSATFRSLPDVPFENIEVTVPTGQFSEFGANLPAKAHGSFCGQSLKMPTFLKGQNGLEIRQSTPVKVTGCPKAHKANKARHGRKGKGRSATRGG